LLNPLSVGQTRAQSAIPQRSQVLQQSVSTKPLEPTSKPALTSGFAKPVRSSGALRLDKEARHIDQTIAQSNPQHIKQKAQQLARMGLVPKGIISANELQSARQGLRQVSEHAVLTLIAPHESDASRTTSIESGRSLRLAQGGVTFDKDCLPSEHGTLDIIGHGSSDGQRLGGKTPSQLAKVLQDKGITHLKTLNLKSCYSESFAQALATEIGKLNQAGANIQIDQITGAKGPIAIARATGQSLTPTEATTAVHDGFLELTEEQQAVVKDLFAGAYDTATFKRQAFSSQDRVKAWLIEAKAEASQVFLDDFEEDEVLAVIHEMGLSIKGIHLRHMIPYSDIAGLMRVATSDTTESGVSLAFRDQVRTQVSELVDLIAPEQQGSWDAIKNDSGLLTSPAGREEVKGIYRALAHSQQNLFQGGGSVNSSISNRPDFSEHTSALIGERHALALADWHHRTLNILGLNLGVQDVEVHVQLGDRTGMLSTQVMGHDLSRHMHGKIYAGSEAELRLELPRVYNPETRTFDSPDVGIVFDD